MRRFIGLFERLEDRKLLSGDAPALQNAFWPADVDNVKVAPQESLHLVNALNISPSWQLATAARASGEAVGTSRGGATGYIDVNGDDHLTSADALGANNASDGGEGESKPTDVVRYSLTVTDTSNSSLPTNSDGSYAVTTGQTFRLHGSLQDVRNILGGTSTGVFAAYMNLMVNNSERISLRYGETQQLLFVPTHFDPHDSTQGLADTITGPFTLTFQGETTSAINAQATIDLNTGEVLESRAQLIQDALAALPSIGTGNVEVTKSLTNGNAFNIRFINSLGEQDVPVMTGDFRSLTHLQSGSITDNFYPADLSNPGTFASSFAHPHPYINGPSPSADMPVPVLGGSPFVEVGSFLDGFSVLQPGCEKEFFAADFQAMSAGVVNFSGTLPSTPTGHETLVFRSDDGSTEFSVDPQFIGFVQDSSDPLRLMVSGLGVTINRATNQPDPTDSSPIRFTVVFSEPVTGFTSEDLVIAGTAGATTATVTGIGTTYDVAVSGMARRGTVSAAIAAGATVNAAGDTNLASISKDDEIVFCPWHNTADAYDVDRNGSVAALDVLTIIIYINGHSDDTSLPLEPEGAHPFYDTNDDDACTPLDVLAVINYINNHTPGFSEGEMAAPTAKANSLPTAVAGPFDGAVPMFQVAEEPWMAMVSKAVTTKLQPALVWLQTSSTHGEAPRTYIAMGRTTGPHFVDEILSECDSIGLDGVHWDISPDFANGNVPR